MSNQSVRLEVLTKVLVGALTEAEAASLLHLSARHVRRLKGALARGGPTALLHGNRGRQPVHRYPDEIRNRLVQLATGKYTGCSYQRSCELLAERENIVVSPSTLSRVLRAAGVRIPHPRRMLSLPAGMLPISFDLAQKRVKLLDLRGADFREPSFRATVDRWRRERPDGLSLELELEAFVGVARRQPGRLPDGFIFNVGRCGSTLLANMLSVPSEHLVIKESPSVNTLLVGVLNAVDETRRLERKALVELVLPFMFRPTRGTEERLFFELSSWNVRLADTLLKLFPATPAVFLYRSASPSVASMLAEPPGWGYLLERPRGMQARLFPTMAVVPAESVLSAAAFYAHAWRSAVEAALALPSERLLLIEYDELVANPESTLARLMTHFGQAVERAKLSAMVSVREVYSKDPVGRAVYQPEGAHRDPVLDAAQEAEVRSTVGDLPRRLAVRRKAADARVS